VFDLGALRVGNALRIAIRCKCPLQKELVTRDPLQQRQRVEPRRPPSPPALLLLLLPG